MPIYLFSRSPILHPLSLTDWISQTKTTLCSLRQVRLGIALLLALALTTTAHATPVTFSLQNGAFGSGAILTGTVVIDTATGSMVSADLTYTLGGSSVTFDRAFFVQFTTVGLRMGNFVPVIGAGVVDGPGDPNAQPPAVDEFDLLLPGSSLVGYSGGPVCAASITLDCGGATYSEYYGRVNFVIDHGLPVPGWDVMTSGTLVPLAVATPEPSEFALTLTGMALCCSLVRGRWYGARLSKQDI